MSPLTQTVRLIHTQYRHGRKLSFHLPRGGIVLGSDQTSKGRARQAFGRDKEDLETAAENVVDDEGHLGRGHGAGEGCGWDVGGELSQLILCIARGGNKI